MGGARTRCSSARDCCDIAYLDMRAGAMPKGKCADALLPRRLYMYMYVCIAHAYIQIEKTQLTHESYSSGHLTPMCCMFVTCILERYDRSVTNIV